jgi:two-component system, OmpR family, KDP operon response regulator KdpE
MATAALGNNMEAIATKTVRLHSATVLLVNDKPKIRRGLQTALICRGYEALEARNPEEALLLIRSKHVDLILFDLDTPGQGLEGCQSIRRLSHAPIIMLSTCNNEWDKVQALNAVVDGFMVKPFGVGELMARIRSMLRRSMLTKGHRPFVSSDLTVDFDQRLVTLKGRCPHLTPKEFNLLRYFIANRNRSLSHLQILQAIWGPDSDDERESLRVLVNHLRKKIEPDALHPSYIHTEPWAGYRFEAPSEKRSLLAGAA